jgi:heat-inducible transcriptional repressor
VLIGPENVADELKDSSVIVASYDAGDNMRGLIGVVGPTRMDYSAVAAKLKFLADGLSRRLGGGETPPPGMNNKLIIKGDDK